MANWLGTDVQELFNGSVGAGVTESVDVDCTGYKSLTVVVSLLATTTTTDLSSQGFVPYRADGTTAGRAGMPTVRSQAAASDGSNVNAIWQLDVGGIRKLAIKMKNANAGAKTMEITAYLGTA